MREPRGEDQESRWARDRRGPGSPGTGSLPTPPTRFGPRPLGAQPLSPSSAPSGGEQGARRGSGSRVAETGSAPRLWLWSLTRSKSERRLHLRAELGALGSGLRPMGNIGLRDSTPDSSPSPPQAQRSRGADDKRRAGEGHRGARPNPDCADTCKEPRNT